MNDAIRMQLSAFVDGELPENEAELLLRRMSQDTELRQDVAEYLAIGRLMRCEPGLAAADRLHERVTAEIEERTSAAEESVIVMNRPRAIRPLAGIAIAASVALLAIFALQNTPEVIDDAPLAVPLPLASETVPPIDAQQERQRQYFLNHSDASSSLGANGLVSRVVTLRFSEDIIVDADLEEDEEPSEASEGGLRP